MSRHLNLVESDFEQLEKIILPRFPFTYMTFKCSKKNAHVFEVKDISNSGMQLGLKEGEHNLKEKQKIHGFIHWGGDELEITGTIKWRTNQRIGVEFSTQASSRKQMDGLLELERIAGLMKPVHRLDYGVDMPGGLKYWLRSDGPVEIFVWNHSDGEMAKFQILMMEQFVEWEDIKGLKTARVMSKRDIETPLITEDEYVFKIDENLDDEKVERAFSLAKFVDSELMTDDAMDFIRLKLRP